MRFNGKKFQSASINASCVRQSEFVPSDCGREERIGRMAERFVNGQDLYTGEPLRGNDAEQWLILQCEAEEREPEAVCFA